LHYEAECDNSDCEKEFENITKFFEGAKNIKIPPDYFLKGEKNE